MDDLWKIWKVITPKEGIMAIGAIMVGSFVIHMMVMLSNDRYVTGLLGGS